MPCTTILVGKNASYDGSTMIARNDDGRFDVKKLIVVKPEDQPRVYKNVLGHVEIPLPENPLRYTATPNVDTKDGIWAANGINSANVAMTATETITSNALVLGADPYGVYTGDDADNKTGRSNKGLGIGEEDFVAITLPYVKTAREGVERLGSLLEKYGTYEPNGIAFSDKDEIWWMETIGGHNWIAKRVPDDRYVIMPNQFGTDNFDFNDAEGDQKNHMCSTGLRELMTKHHMHLEKYSLAEMNPRLAFGSRRDADHVYNTPRAWFMARYFNPRTYKWDGYNADYTPESNDIPWSLVPEHKITVEEIKYILSSYYQGTPYNIFGKGDSPKKGMYRPIAVCNTGVMAVLQIRPYMPEEIAALEWVCFGANAFNTLVPVYTNTDSIPAFLSGTELDVSTDNLYWTSRLIATIADAHYGPCIQLIERYQEGTAAKGHHLVNVYDEKMESSGDYSLTAEANEKIAEMAREESLAALKNVLEGASEHMTTRFHRADN
ncbi:MAG: C69 family dipeptidase [Treponemataceae bacterium]|nr:C69 family dipeptidase [Treponemataceae bacterium]